MWKIGQLMINAKRETKKGYGMYGYYLSLLKSSNVAATAEYEKYRAELFNIFIEGDQKND